MALRINELFNGPVGVALSTTNTSATGFTGAGTSVFGSAGVAEGTTSALITTTGSADRQVTWTLTNVTVGYFSFYITPQTRAVYSTPVFRVADAVDSSGVFIVWLNVSQQIELRDWMTNTPLEGTATTNGLVLNELNRIDISFNSGAASLALYPGNAQANNAVGTATAGNTKTGTISATSYAFRSLGNEDTLTANYDAFRESDTALPGPVGAVVAAPTPLVAAVVESDTLGATLVSVDAAVPTALAGGTVEADTLAAALTSSVALVGAAVESDTLNVALMSATAITATVVETDTVAVALKTSTALAVAFVEIDAGAVVLGTSTALAAGVSEADTFAVTLGTSTTLSAALVEADGLAGTLATVAALTAAILDVDTVTAALSMGTALGAVLVETDTGTATLGTSTQLGAAPAETDTLTATLITSTRVAAALVDTDTIGVVLGTTTGVTAALLDTDTLSVALVSPTSLAVALLEMATLAVALSTQGAPVTLAVVPAFGTIPFTVTATATAYASAGAILSYAFAWGDGGTTAPNASASATHLYVSSGIYSPVCTVSSSSVGTLAATATETDTLTAALTSAMLLAGALRETDTSVVVPRSAMLLVSALREVDVVGGALASASAGGQTAAVTHGTQLLPTMVGPWALQGVTKGAESLTVIPAPTRGYWRTDTPAEFSPQQTYVLNNLPSNHGGTVPAGGLVIDGYAVPAGTFVAQFQDMSATDVFCQGMTSGTFLFRGCRFRNGTTGDSSQFNDSGSGAGFSVFNHYNDFGAPDANTAGGPFIKMIGGSNHRVLRCMFSFLGTALQPNVQGCVVVENYMDDFIYIYGEKGISGVGPDVTTKHLNGLSTEGGLTRLIVARNHIIMPSPDKSTGPNSAAGQVSYGSQPGQLGYGGGSNPGRLTTQTDCIALFTLQGENIGDATTGIQIKDNFLGGSGYSLYGGNTGTATNNVYTGNRFTTRYWTDVASHGPYQGTVPFGTAGNINSDNLYLDDYGTGGDGSTTIANRQYPAGNGPRTGTSAF